MTKSLHERIVHMTYLDPVAIRKSKKKDWLENVEQLHKILDDCGIPRGDAHGAYTLIFRVCALRAQRDNVVSSKLRETLAAAQEARAALYGAYEIIGSVGNVQHAIDLLDSVLGVDKANG